MRFMEEKAAEKHPDCLVSSCAVLQVYKLMRTPSKVLLHSSARLEMSPYSSMSCRMRFMGEKAASKLPDRLIRGETKERK